MEMAGSWWRSLEDKHYTKIAVYNLGLLPRFAPGLFLDLEVLAHFAPLGYFWASGY